MTNIPAELNDPNAEFRVELLSNPEAFVAGLRETKQPYRDARHAQMRETLGWKVGGEILVSRFHAVLEELDGLQEMIDSFAAPKKAFMRIGYRRLTDEQRAATPRLSAALFPDGYENYQWGMK